MVDLHGERSPVPKDGLSIPESVDRQGFRSREKGRSFSHLGHPRQQRVQHGPQGNRQTHDRNRILADRENENRGHAELQSPKNKLNLINRRQAKFRFCVFIFHRDKTTTMTTITEWGRTSDTLVLAEEGKLDNSDLIRLFNADERHTVFLIYDPEKFPLDVSVVDSAISSDIRNKENECIKWLTKVNYPGFNIVQIRSRYRITSPKWLRNCLDHATKKHLIRIGDLQSLFGLIDFFVYPTDPLIVEHFIKERRYDKMDELYDIGYHIRGEPISLCQSIFMSVVKHVLGEKDKWVMGRQEGTFDHPLLTNILDVLKNDALMEFIMKHKKDCVTMKSLLQDEIPPIKNDSLRQRFLEEIASNEKDGIIFHAVQEVWGHDFDKQKMYERVVQNPKATLSFIQSLYEPGLTLSEKTVKESIICHTDRKDVQDWFHDHVLSHYDEKKRFRNMVQEECSRDIRMCVEQTMEMFGVNPHILSSSSPMSSDEDEYESSSSSSDEEEEEEDPFPSVFADSKKQLDFKRFVYSTVGMDGVIRFHAQNFLRHIMDKKNTDRDVWIDLFLHVQMRRPLCAHRMTVDRMFADMEKFYPRGDFLTLKNVLMESILFKKN